MNVLGTHRLAGLMVRVDSVQRQGAAVVVHGEIRRDGKPVPLSWPVVVVNAPVLVPDPLGTDLVRSSPNGTARRYRRDESAALLQVLADLARAS